MDATVSIVIPTFNRASMLPNAINSALNQTFPVEVIVVDHGSCDETPYIAAQFGDEISYIRREKDFGPHFCWLEGVLHSTGSWVHLQYDDDWIMPNFIRECIGVIDPDTGFAFTGAFVVEAPGQSPKSQLYMDWSLTTGIHTVDVLEPHIPGHVISCGAALYRRQVLIDALYQGNLPLQTAQYHGVGPDAFATLLSLLRYPKFGFVNQPIAFFRSHGGSITIDAYSSPEKGQRMNAAYNEVKRFYYELKLLRSLRVKDGWT